MQADTSAVSLQRKNAASANQKWTIEKVAGTEDQYYLKNGSRYASTSANRHAQVSMSDTAQAWRLAKVEPEVKLSLGSSTIRTGESTTAAVTGFDADGAELDGSKAVLTSENPDIAEVSGNTVIAKKAGTATIKAAFEGKEVSTELTVLEAAKEWPGVYRIDNVEFAGYLIEPGADNVSEGNNLYLCNTALPISQRRKQVLVEHGTCPDTYVGIYRSRRRLCILASTQQCITCDPGRRYGFLSFHGEKHRR